MRLIRLESDSVVTKSEFTNNMAIPLEVSANAKVALKTLTMQFDAPPIVIDSTNNTFSLRTDTGSTLLEGALQRRQYESVETLCKEIQTKLNALMQSTDDEGVDKSSVGLEWSSSATQDPSTNNSKVTIAFNRSDSTLVVPTDTNLKNITNDANVFFKSAGGNTGDFNASLEVKTPISEGGYAYEVQLVNHGMANVADSTWKFYLKKYNNDISNGVLATDGFYQFYKNGQWTDSTIPVEADDIITVTKSLVLSFDTRINYRITNNDIQKANVIGDKVSELNEFRNTLWLEIADEEGEVGFQLITYIPTTQVTSVGGQLIKKRADEVLHVIRDNNLKTTPSTVTLTLSDGLARLLGYAPPVLTQNAKSYAFIAQTNVTTNIFNNDIIVELIQLPLNGYDHGVKRSKNILMVITSGALNASTNATGVEQYELSFTDSFPTYISLQNSKQSTTYSQLTVRVTSANQTLVTNGRMSALLLFKDDSDY